MKTQSLVAVGIAAMVVIASIGLYSYYYSNVGAKTSSQTSQASTAFSSTASSQLGSQNSMSFRTSISSTFASRTFTKGNFSSSTNSTSGLTLTLSMNAVTMRMYDTLVARAQEVNPSPQSINITAADNWVAGASGSGGACGSADLVGIAVFRGNYTKSNLPARGTAGQLALRGGGCLPTGYSLVPHSYVFQPQSALATEAFGCEPFGPNQLVPCPCGGGPNACSSAVGVRQAETKANVSISKYFDLSSNDQYSSYRYLFPGVYTLVGLDEWGAIAILHFEVANPGCPFPQTGQQAPPFANMAGTVNGSWNFQLLLNSTFVFRDQSLHVSASITDTNLTDAYFPHILVSNPFLASLQFISPNGTVVWAYPPSPRTTLTSFVYSRNDGLDVTSKTMSLLQSNQTYTVVAKPMLFTQPDQPFPTGVQVRMNLTVC